MRLMWPGDCAPLSCPLRPPGLQLGERLQESVIRLAGHLLGWQTCGSELSYLILSKRTGCWVGTPGAKAFRHTAGEEVYVTGGSVVWKKYWPNSFFHIRNSEGETSSILPRWW